MTHDTAFPTRFAALDANAFDEVIASSDVPVLVDFWAHGCAPCTAMETTLEVVSTDLGDRLAIYQVDVDQHRDLVVRFGVQAMPTLLVFVDGRPVKQIVGARGPRRLVDDLADVLT